MFFADDETLDGFGWVRDLDDAEGRFPVDLRVNDPRTSFDE